MGGRRRNIFVLLFVAGLVIASVIVSVSKPTQLGLDLQGGIELTLQGRPTPQAPEVTTEAMDRSVDIIRSGCDRLGISGIRLNRDRFSAVALDLLDYGRGRISPFRVSDGNLRSVPGQAFGDGGADPARATRYDCNLSFEFHIHLLRFPNLNFKISSPAG